MKLNPLKLLSRQPREEQYLLFRKADELRDIDEISANYGTRRKLNKDDMSNGEAVKLGRDYYANQFSSHTFYRVWPNNLASALDRAGFIRHDINDRTFMVGKLYRRIYQMSGRDISRIFTSYDQIITNEDYESCQIVTDEVFYNLIAYLDLLLGKRDARVIKLLYGFEDGRPRSYSEVGELYGVHGQCVRQQSRRSLRKLADSGCLPPLPYPPSP